MNELVVGNHDKFDNVDNIRHYISTSALTIVPTNKLINS